MTWQRIWRTGWFSLVALGLFFWTESVFAQEWQLTEFRSDIIVQPDTSIDVTEIIDTNFLVEKHGIFRDVPFRYDTGDGSQLVVPIDIKRVELNGQRVPVEETVQGNNVHLKIGDPNKTMTGQQTYLIEYTAEVAINFFEEHDELFWNATGSDWEVPIQSVTTTVQLPASVPTGDIRVGCFTGDTGSRDRDCEARSLQDGAVFTAKDSLTIVVGWPKGIVTKPSNYEAIRQQAERQGQFPWTLIDSPWKQFGNVVLPMVALFGLIWWWRRYGRDPDGKRTIVAQYDPPEGLRPGEVGVVIDEYANHHDVVATIVDLAVRGYLEITEVEKKKLIGKSTDYELKLKKSIDDGDLRVHEHHVLKGLFGTATETSISERKGKMHKEIQQAESDMYREVVERGHFLRNPHKVRQIFMGVGFAVVVLGGWAAATGVYGLFLIGGIVILTGRAMPKRTTKGVRALWHARGFKLFLEKAEKYRIKWQEREHIFEEFLPYAMAFGVADKWSKAFEGIQQEAPSWYHGQPGSTFNSMLLWSALSDFSSVSSKSFTPPAAAGSSGFSGGGFSGGGFGGGGGGSW